MTLKELRNELEKSDDLAVASLKWLLSNESTLSEALRRVVAEDDEEDDYIDSSPIRTLARLLVCDIHPHVMAKILVDGRAAFWSYESEDDPHLSIEELYQYEVTLRKELLWTVGEKKRRIVLLSSEEDDEGAAPHQ